jgi:hypothetical protein
VRSRTIPDIDQWLTDKMFDQRKKPAVIIAQGWLRNFPHEADHRDASEGLIVNPSMNGCITFV